MLCFRRKKCFESNEEEFTRLQEEPISTQKSAMGVNVPSHGKVYRNNIRNVTSQRILVANGKPLEVFNVKPANHQHRQVQARSGHIQKSQTFNYKNLPDRNNDYGAYKNPVTVQRSQSAHYPVKPPTNSKGPARSPEYESKPNYARLEDIHFDWYVVKDENGEKNKISKSVKTETSSLENSSELAKERDSLEQTLAHLDDTLNSYSIDVFESDSNDDEGGNTTTKNSDQEISDSEKEPSSTDSGVISPKDSLNSNTSVNSRNGIISKHGAKTAGSKRTSVSFKLPADHVDKPYNPLQQSKAKSKFSNIVTVSSINHGVPVVRNNINHHKVPTICVWDSNHKMWHMKEGVTYLDGKDDNAYMHPFRGSFLNLFYGKFSNSDIRSGDQIQQGKAYLAPGILQKIESFESLKEADHGSGARTFDPRRHSIAHY